MPTRLEKLYKFLNVKDKTYTKLRYRLCPFEKIENKIPKKARVLDIGCGYGLLTNLIAINSEKREVSGIDLSNKRISIAKKSVGNRNNINFELKNCSEINLKNYDVVIMSDFLHHINYEKQEKLIKDIYKDLNKGGLLIIQDVDKKTSIKYYSTYTSS